MSTANDFIKTVLSKLNVEQDLIDDIKNALCVALNDYEVVKKSKELAISDSDTSTKAIQMFFVSKKIKGCTDKTLNYYSLVLRCFFEQVGCDLSTINADVIRYYLAQRSIKDKVSKTTQNNELRVLRSFFNWAAAEEYIVKNPITSVESIREEKRIKKAFTEYELERIRKSCKTLRDRALVEVLFSTGARVSEVAGMNRSDVAGDEIIVFGKGEKERVTYLNAKSRFALDEYLDSRDDKNEALFVSLKKPHTRMSSGAIEVRIREIGKHAGVKKCHPHRFRRTAATLALNRGMPLDQVSKMLGHEKIETTTIYARSDIENVKASHKKYVS